MDYTSTRGGLTVTVEDGALAAMDRRAACDCPTGCWWCEGPEE